MPACELAIFLTGPTGSGKTDTSWALLRRIEGLVFLDCDWFASRAGFDWDRAADVDSVWRALHGQLAFHSADGRTRFVITLTLELAIGFGARRAAFAAPGRMLHAFRLTCPPATLSRRIDARDRDQKTTEAANAIMQTSRFAALFPDDRLFCAIDTGEIDADAVAGLIARLAGLRP